MVGPTPSVAEATVGQRFERYSLCVRLLTVEVLKVIEYESADAVAPSLVREFIERRRRADGSFALSEHKALRIEGSDDSRAIVGRDVGGTLVAYAQAAWHRPGGEGVGGHWGVEIVMSPDIDGAEAVGNTMDVLRANLPNEDQVAVWAFEGVVAEGLLMSGYRESRRLLKLSAPLPLRVSVEHGSLPGVRLGRFVAARDAQSWIELNNAAFSGHPENGSLSSDDLSERMDLDWFDPAGFIVAREASRLVGFCWTKMHPHTTGEIYIIAVDPDEQGRGIGTALLVRGAQYLEGQRGAATIVLHVEGANTGAVAFYRSAGFEVASVSSQYELPRPELS